MINMKMVRIGGIALFIALIGASLGLAFFRQIDGANLRTMILERHALDQRAVQQEQLIFRSETSVEALNKELARRDELISRLKEDHAVLLAKRKQQINRLKEELAALLAKRKQQINRLKEDHAAELAQRDKRIGELQKAVGNAR